MRLIDADKIPYIEAANLTGKPSGKFYARREDICAMPTIEPERKTGKWIYGEDEYGIDGYHCDKCGFFVPWDYVHNFINYIDDYNFCPTAGLI